jgi:hypothetical protein
MKGEEWPAEAGAVEAERPEDSPSAAGGPGTPGWAGGGSSRGRALWGWSPPDRPADTPLKRRADRLPRTGVRAVACYAVVVGLLILAPRLPMRAALATDGLAALAAGAWCGLNFWRCRHAHCAVTSAGWLALSVLAFTGAALGHSLIGGYEQPVFLAVLAAGLGFETVWRWWRGTNAITRHRPRRHANGAG